MRGVSRPLVQEVGKHIPRAKRAPKEALCGVSPVRLFKMEVPFLTSAQESASPLFSLSILNSSFSILHFPHRLREKVPEQRLHAAYLVRVAS